jgi:hypothetical protein
MLRITPTAPTPRALAPTATQREGVEFKGETERILKQILNPHNASRSVGKALEHISAMKNNTDSVVIELVANRKFSGKEEELVFDLLLFQLIEGIPAPVLVHKRSIYNVNGIEEDIARCISYLHGLFTSIVS